MKVKVKNAKGEITADYYNAKNMHDFRFGVLKLIAGMAEKSITLFVDTNSSVKKIPPSDIIELLGEHSEEYMMEPTHNTERKLFGLSWLFKGKKKPQKTEKLIAAKINKDKLSRQLYDGFLQYYDYGIGLDCTLSTEEMLKIYSEGYEDVLFNKEILPETFYDSILFARLRTDCADSGFESNLRQLGR
jgi:hypothetical protein